MKSHKLSRIFCMAIAILIIGIIANEKASTIDSAYKLEFTVEFDSNNLLFETMNDYDLVRFNTHTYLNVPGQPMLPVNRFKYALPDGMAAAGVEIVSVEFEVIPGEFNIFPSQPPLETKFDNSIIDFYPADIEAYKSTNPYPSEILTLDRQSDLAGQSFAEIDIYPLQYTASEKSLRMISKISFVIKGNDGYICGDYLPETASEKVRDSYKKRLENLIVNKEDISLNSSAPMLKMSGSLPPGGPYDHVIITRDLFAQYYDPLVFWHNRKGVRDTVITTEYIYDNYDGLGEKGKIRNFIIDAHQNWGTMYFLMGGEHSTVPFEYRLYDGDAVPSDAYYADYDDDWEYEVYVGRITAEGSPEITRFVNKVLKYETDPPDIGFVLNMTLLGMDLTGASEPPYYTLTRSQWLKDTVEIAHMPPGYIVKHVFDTDAGNHRDEFLAAINSGQNIINHSDHSNSYVMGCGDRNHGWYISSYDVPYLTNYFKYCNIYSLGCDANNMPMDDAISEKFVFSTDSTGAVSFTGNTHSGWFYVGDPLSLSSELDLYWWIAVMEQGINRLGEMLAYCKSATNIESIHPYSDWTLNLLGEPEMPLWTGNLDYPMVTHQTEVEALPAQLTVSIEKFGNIPVADALVCLWKGSEVYERVYTDVDGNALMDIYPTTNGTIYLTVTGDNLMPYMGEIAVVGNVPPQCLTPGDTTIFQCTPEQIMLPVGCYDPDDNLETGPSLAKGAGEIIDGFWIFTPSGNELIEVTIVCTDSLGFFCETSFTVQVEINEIPALTVPNDTTILAIWPPTEMALAVSAVDDNISGCEVILGPGTIEDGLWVYTPPNDENSDITIQLSDNCGLVDEKTFHLDYEVYKCGDANDNGEVNILDVTLLINHLYNEGPAPDPIQAGDANGNGAINILDITFIISYLYQNGQPPQCP